MNCHRAGLSIAILKLGVGICDPDIFGTTNLVVEDNNGYKYLMLLHSQLTKVSTSSAIV